jgi:hypothetical protein
MTDIFISNKIDLSTRSSKVRAGKNRRSSRKSEYFSRLQEPLELALNEVTYSMSATHRWIKLCITYVDFVSPGELLREPGRLMRLLSEYPSGLKRDEMLSKFYEQYEEASLLRKESFRICLEKIVQRARVIFSKYDLTIQYCKETKRYLIQPLFILSEAENNVLNNKKEGKN